MNNKRTEIERLQTEIEVLEKTALELKKEAKKEKDLCMTWYHKAEELRKTNSKLLKELDSCKTQIAKLIDTFHAVTIKEENDG